MPGPRAQLPAAEPALPNKLDRRFFVAIVVGCVILPVLMVCILGALATQQSRAVALHARVARSFETQMELARVFSLVQDAETGQRGFILTGQLSFLQPYSDATARLGQELSSLDRMLDGDLAQTRDAALLNDLMRLKLGELENVVGLRQQGRTGEAVAIIEDRYGQVVMDRIRVVVARMHEVERLETAVAIRQAEAAGDLTNLLIGALLGAIGLFVAAAAGLAAATLARRHALILRLSEQKDEADRANAVKAQFLANMSHEIRTPLTSILGFSQLVRAQPDLTDVTRRHVDRVLAATGTLLSVVSDVLDFSKLEAGETKIERSSIGVPRLVGEVVGLFEEQAAAKGVTIETICAPDVPANLMADPNRLQQILLNLVGNALKFTETGAIRVVLAWQAPGRLRLDVIDPGPGISPAGQAVLFQRFSQVDGSTTSIHGGAGLGLAICKGLVEAMGGRIGVESSVGSGSRFWFEIPADVAPPVDIAASAREPAQMAADARVLVVDDNEANRELVRAVLGGLDLELTIVASGEEALDATLSAPFDLILMDIRMPGIGGLEAMKRIRRSGSSNADVPILAFTADADVQSAARLIREGFDGHVAKPIDISGLISAVAHWTSDETRASQPRASKA